ncbi:uncharacterized protein At2g39795, mitochondrial-like [Carex rostrata]
MAFSTFLRRVASSTAPLLLRSFSASACALRQRSLSLVSAQSMILRHRWAFSSSFSSSSSFAMAKAPMNADASLLRVLESEIKCAEEGDDHKHVDEVPEGFPFEIEDKGMKFIRLKRIYQGKEKIEVVVGMPSLVKVPKVEEDKDEKGLRICSQASWRIPFIVRVSKDERVPALNFGCVAYPDEVIINSMSLIETQGGEEEEEDLLNYKGPDFNYLDERLKKAFYKYLELRGIMPLNTNFIHKYMINKDRREYLPWLRNLKAIVQKIFSNKGLFRCF